MKHFINIVLMGEKCELKPIKLLHTNHLFSISRNNRIWKYLSMYPQTLEEMTVFIKTAIAGRKNKTTIPFVIIDKETNKIIGTSRIVDILEQHKTCEIGYTWISHDYWGKNFNTEVKYLMLQYCFDELKFRRVQMKIDEKNIRAQKAAEKIGFTKEGLLRNLRNYSNGTYTNTLIYSIIDIEWNKIKPLILSIFNHDKEIGKILGRRVSI